MTCCRAMCGCVARARRSKPFPMGIQKRRPWAAFSLPSGGEVRAGLAMNRPIPVVGAHPVRDRRASAQCSRRLFAHWVRSYRRLATPVWGAAALPSPRVNAGHKKSRLSPATVSFAHRKAGFRRLPYQPEMQYAEPAYASSRIFALRRLLWRAALFLWIRPRAA